MTGRINAERKGRAMPVKDSLTAVRACRHGLIVAARGSGRVDPFTPAGHKS
ncbi:MAG: hypothetical protein LLG00_10155 [Planctomycetaceae bacterium]|nr:hypothetical protein [Planctomycetaceae bacterium]